jgi:uroporphyrinogen-III synthase
LANPDTALLAGRSIVVTRAPEQAAELIQRLEQLGAQVLLLPAVTFADAPDPGPLDRAITAVPQFDWLLFTSQNAVHFFAKRCRSLGAAPQDRRGAEVAATPLVAAVGPATAEAAVKEGYRVDYTAKEFRGAALAEGLGPRLKGKRVLLPRSDRAAEDLPEALRAHGAEITEVIAYHTAAPENLDSGAVEAIRQGRVDAITFMSPSAFHHLLDQIGSANLRQLSARVALAAIGPVTSAAIREAGLAVAMEAREATVAALVEAITGYFAQRQPSGVKSS